MYYFEDYFSGFVLGMTAGYPATSTTAANVACIATQPIILAWGRAFD